MQIIQFCQKSIKFLLTSVLFLASFSVYAKEIPMFDQPVADAKETGKIDLAAGIIPIFSSKDGKWMKVGDPRNGNVGWIKSSDVNDSNSKMTFTYTQRVIDNGKDTGPRTYQIIEYGNQSKLSSDDAKKMIQKMQAQQEAQQKAMQEEVQNMMEEMNQMYNIDNNLMNNMRPIIMPVVIVPGQAKPTDQKPAAVKPAAVKPATVNHAKPDGQTSTETNKQ